MMRSRMLKTVSAGRTLWKGRTGAVGMLWKQGLVESSVRRMGLWDSIRGGYDQARDAQAEKAQRAVFEAQMKQLTSLDRMFDAAAYAEILQDMKGAAGMSGVREHLPWVKNNSEYQQLAKQEKLLQGEQMGEYSKSRPWEKSKAKS
mmetsp:Transcript_7640/g.15497  ORF Transcript_7640/g.15497 Transcript_7640/m.15497 type:complete len:146 (-) Transcript_7640:2271-2708(-)